MTQAHRQTDVLRAGRLSLKRRLANVESLTFDAPEDDLRRVKKLTLDTIREVFGEGSEDFKRYMVAAAILEKPSITNLLMDRGDWDERKARSMKLLIEADEHVEELLERADLQVTTALGGAPRDTAAVFLVHGRDGALKHEVARFVQDIGLKPIILDEQANSGMTIIEKFKKHGNVGFAIILLSADDEGALRGQASRPRARQNVVLEYGYFLAKLDPERVCALSKGDIELPSDLLGVGFIKYEGDWKLQIIKEMKAAGYSMDLNKIT